MEYKVYVKLNENGYITAINSSDFISDITGWTEIDRGYGDKYHHAQGNYFPKSTYTGGGAYRYKLIDGKPVVCTQEEIAEQERNLSLSSIPTAPRNITEGEYITVDGVLYKATTNIPNGCEIIVGQNAIVTTVEEQLYELMKGVRI